MRKKVKEIKETIFLLACGFSIAVFLVSQAGHIINNNVGCDGIEQFFTGRGFWLDKNSLVINSKNSGFYNYTTSENIHFMPLPPKEIGNGHKYDCKTISNALFCLSKYYGLKCRFENTVRLNSDFTFGPGHVGLYCWNETREEWVLAY